MELRALNIIRVVVIFQLFYFHLSEDRLLIGLAATRILLGISEETFLSVFELLGRDEQSLAGTLGDWNL